MNNWKDLKTSALKKVFFEENEEIRADLIKFVKLTEDLERYDRQLEKKQNKDK